MSSLNMMPLYTDAYLADTTHLTIEEHGAYLKLLIVMWRNGGWLPDDDGIVARYLGVTSARWKKLKSVVGTFFSYDNDRFTQKKLQEIFADKTKLSEENRENGKRGGKAKSQNYNKTTLANATVSLENNSSEALPYQKPDTRYQKGEASASPPGERDENFFEKCFKLITDAWPEITVSNPAPIHAWQQSGYDFETQVKPTVESIIRKGSKPRSFSFFTTSIEDIAKVKMLAAPAKPKPIVITPEYEEGQRKFYRKTGIRHDIYNPDGLKETQEKTAKK